MVRLPPLFADEGEYARVPSNSRRRMRPRRADSSRGHGLSGHHAGSTHVQGRLIGDSASVVAITPATRATCWAAPAPRRTNLYNDMPVNADTGEPLVRIGHATVTGYGEHLLLEAAARGFRRDRDRGSPARRAGDAAGRGVHPSTSAAQDMKCHRVKDGVIDHIMLNEACSLAAAASSRASPRASTWRGRVRSDCHRGQAPPGRSGQPLHRVHEQPREAGAEGRRHRGRLRRGPGHLRHQGTPCSKSSKSATALTFGTKVIVQGGTFLNDAVLRAFEQLSEV